VDAAWYQTRIVVPEHWAGRRVALTAEFVNSFATVYLDGRKVADIRFPAGEADLTPMCRPGGEHVLSILVRAMPLRAVMMSYNDSDAAKEVKGRVGMRGLCGDVCLEGTPRAARIDHVRVETSVRAWRLAFSTALKDVDPAATYVLRAEVRDGVETVKEVVGEPFRGADALAGRVTFGEDWHPDKLWDMHTPGNQYEATVSLLAADGTLLDEALPERFGFREFWIEGRDFYLNGTRVFLSFARGQRGWTYEETRRSLEQRRSVGINFVAVGGFGCLPGAHRGFDGVLRASDDYGTVVALTQPHFSAYDWDAPDAEQTNGYARHAEFYARVAGNHPSVVFYAASHNGTGYAEDMNPDLIDGLVDRTQWSRGPNVERAERVRAIIERTDPTRVMYHHSSGNLATMHTSNFYSNFTPVQEMSDWFGHWGTVGVKPVHTCEYGAPLCWDWAMYRGWYKGKREYGSASVPWEFCIAEWNAQFMDAESYKIGAHEAENLRWEAERFRNGELWHRWDWPYDLNYLHPERDPVLAMYFAENWRAFRTWGMSITAPEGYGSPLSTAALMRNNRPLLAYIGGPSGAFTRKDHNFRPGESFEKQLIVINNSRVTVTADCTWTLHLPRPVHGKRVITLPTGEQERIPLRFALPAGLPAGRYELTAMVHFSSGETQADTFAIDVLPAPAAVRARRRIALFDPKGETAAMLKKLGIAYRPVDATSDLSRYSVLVIGKGALTLDGPAPDVTRVRDGLKVVVFEQTGEVLEKRFGFRIAEYGLRWVYKRVPDHPLLAGLAGEHLRNWRGDSTTLPPRLKYELAVHFDGPEVEWAGLPVSRGWRCGNRGNVASAVIEKPAAGDFLPILDGGYSLQYASLMEYREGDGMVLFCQTDVTGRTEADPAAEALVANIVRYVAAWKPTPRRTVVYAGQKPGLQYLKAAGVSPTAYAGRLSADQVLVLGPGARRAVGEKAASVKRWVKGGGPVLAVGLTGKEASELLPLEVKTTRAEHIAAWFEAFGVGSPLVGVSPADVHNRDPRTLPLVDDGATPVGNGVLAFAEDFGVVFCQLPPWKLDYSGEKMNVKRTFRRLAYAANRLLANLGAAGATPLLASVSRPVGDGERRWLDGLYLDVPEEWDDPYRFFRW